MTLIRRKARWSKFLWVPRPILQDFRYYKDRLTTPHPKKVLLVVEPYNDLIYYINLRTIKFIEFIFDSGKIPSTTIKNRSIYYVNKRLRLRRTHFFNLVCNNNLLPVSKKEYLFFNQVPYARFPRKRFGPVKQSIDPKAILIDNFERRLDF